MTRPAGSDAGAQGEIIYVMGRVLNMKGEPVRAAQLEIWQANALGRYVHPSDRNPAPLDPNFQGYANVVSDAEGRYRFKTIKPGAYPGGRRLGAPAAHPLRRARAGQSSGHADVLRGRSFEREGPAAAGLLGQGQPDRQGSAADASEEPSARLVVWDIILIQG
jgi:hypothetical protein